MPEELRFDGRVVIITGAGAGLGRAYALLFASRGASVVVNDLGVSRHGDGSSTKSADTVVAEIRNNGGKAVPNYDSVSDGAKIVKTAIDAFGRLDVLVNNAGILRDKSFAKMTESDWNIIQDIHLKAAFKTTRAAWPYFVKQNYGRVIFTSSNSGLYGNFGQANYSSAKSGLVGLSNSLAIEGKKKNIHTNVIVPTAGSRLTEDILPPDFFSELKPELIAPVVFWLCHEQCLENGTVIESALGWAGKCHLVRSSGCILRQDLNDSVTPEKVQKNWAVVTDMSSAKHFDSLQEVTADLGNVLEKLKDRVPTSQQAVAHSMQTTYNARDIILYALGVGATAENPSDLRFLYENHELFAALPTYYVTYGPMGCFSTSVIQDALQGRQVDTTKILHGEQYIDVHKPLPTEGRVETRYTALDVLDKGKGAVVLIKHETFDTSTGEKLSTGQMSVFIVGAGGFEGKRTSEHNIPTVDPPSRAPDASVSQKTSFDQAALYRLSGDPNPLHIDPDLAAVLGYKRPILHGLCSLGFSVRHVLETYANNDPGLFKSVKVRFAKPVLPNETLRTDMWQDGNRVYFQTSTRETNTVVISGAYVDLLRVTRKVRAEANASSGEEDLECDAVFEAIKDQVKREPNKAKAVNAVFLYNITDKGQTTKGRWTLDLKKGEVYKGMPKSPADATLTVDDKDMVQIATGKLNPQVAFMRGKLKITGNITLTQKLKSLMETSKAKL